MSLAPEDDDSDGCEERLTDELLALLDSVRAQHGEPVRIVVVGNGCRLAGLGPDVETVELPENLGVSGGRNVAWDTLRAHGDVGNEDRAADQRRRNDGADGHSIPPECDREDGQRGGWEQGERGERGNGTHAAPGLGGDRPPVGQQ